MTFNLLYTQTTDAKPPQTITIGVPTAFYAAEIMAGLVAIASRSTGIQVVGFRLDPVGDITQPEGV